MKGMQRHSWDLRGAMTALTPCAGVVGTELFMLMPVNVDPSVLTFRARRGCSSLPGGQKMKAALKM